MQAHCLQSSIGEFSTFKEVVLRNMKLSCNSPDSTLFFKVVCISAFSFTELQCDRKESH